MGASGSCGVDLLVWTVIALTLLALACAIGWGISVARSRRQHAEFLERLQQADAAKRSQSTRYGQITEQFAPFLADWPWDPKGFRFLGTPVDGVQFTPHGIVFVEIKSAGSRLSTLQRQIREHIEAGRVHWHEVRIA